MIASSDRSKVEKLIDISKTRALVPEEFVPWQIEERETDRFLPDSLVSLVGDPLYDMLTAEQQRQLGKHEVVQSLYSYAWSEGLACLFFNRHLLTIHDTTSVEYRFLVRELIEEYRHQSMFADAVVQLGITPIAPSKMHQWVGLFTARFFPSDLVFMSVMAVEEIADVYGKAIRKDAAIYIVLRKISELHHIEEGRHIHYTTMWLRRYTDRAGYVKRTIYSLVTLLNIYFMRSLYVKREIFEKIGVPNPQRYYEAARRNYKKKFAQYCLSGSIAYVDKIGGFNRITRPMWRWVLGANV